jgi:Ulp1 family protease
LTNGVKGCRGIDYEAIQRWTSKIDILSFDYIIVPINEDTHWYLAIICNASKLQNTPTTNPLTRIQGTDAAKESSKEKI